MTFDQFLNQLRPGERFTLALLSEQHISGVSLIYLNALCQRKNPKIVKAAHGHRGQPATWMKTGEGFQ